jgi:hypothetical protein
MDEGEAILRDSMAEFMQAAQAVNRTGGRPEDGHQFHFSVCVQGAHRGADGLYHDESEPVEYEPFTLTVRAWNLAAACRRAAETPLAEWKPFREEVD